MVLTVLVAAGVGYKTAPRVMSSYVARSVILVNMNGAEYSTQIQRINSVTNNTLAALFTSLEFATLLVNDSHVPRNPYQELGAISASPEITSLLVSVQVVDADPGVAARLADAAPQALTQEIGKLGGQLPFIALVAPAVASRPTEGWRRVSNAALGALFGLLLALIAAHLLEHVDVSFATPRDAEQVLDLPVLGAIALSYPWAGPVHELVDARLKPT